MYTHRFESIAATSCQHVRIAPTQQVATLLKANYPDAESIVTSSPREAMDQLLGQQFEAATLLVRDRADIDDWGDGISELWTCGTEVYAAFGNWDKWGLERNLDAIREALETAELIEQAVNQSDNSSPAYVRGLTPLTAVEFLSRKFETAEILMGPFLPIKGLGMIYGPRGTGKTYLSLGIGYAVAAGASFLERWLAPKPHRVVIIDGEMPAHLLQERLAQTAKAIAKDIEPEYLKIIASDLEPDGLPDLSDPSAQRFYDAAIGDAELIIIDNLSTICRSMRENDADTWGPVQTWLLQQRRQGRSVLLIHHAGKGGSQRGTSRKEDILNSVIALRRPPGYTPEQGARFEVHYEKARGFFGPEAEPFEAWLRDGEWHVGPLTCAQDDDFTLRTLKAEGLSVRDIAERTGMSKSSVDRHLKRQPSQ